MAIKPILFNAEMVRVILDGRKTCTRRICKDANECTVPDMDFYNADKRTYAVHNFADLEHIEPALFVREIYCTLGKHGSALNVGIVKGTKAEVAQKNHKKAFWIKFAVAICIEQQMK